MLVDKGTRWERTLSWGGNMKILGIIGGMSPESTATYYTEINRFVNQKKGGNISAPIVMVSVEFEEIVQCQKQSEWQRAGEILAEAGKKLEMIGAEGIVLATNTMHKVAPQIERALSIPFLHILDATADAIKSRGLNKVALLGTKFTMSDNFYRDGLIVRGITPIVPNEDTQNEIDKLKNQGAEGVILGCTEIGLLVNQSDSPLPFFDTAKLHSQMAADFVLGVKNT